jgi:hypothetical protein
VTLLPKEESGRVELHPNCLLLRWKRPQTKEHVSQSRCPQDLQYQTAPVTNLYLAALSSQETKWKRSRIGSQEMMKKLGIGSKRQMNLWYLLPISRFYSLKSVVQDLTPSPSTASVEPEELWTGENNSVSDFILEEKELYNQLRGISDLQFDTLDHKAQEEIMRTIVKQDVVAGSIIIKEGDDDDGGCFYLILGSPCTDVDARVEVVRNVHGTPYPLTGLIF